MRLMVQAVQHNRPSRRGRGGRGGGSSDSEDSSFGEDDDDWDVYKHMHGGSDSGKSSYLPLAGKRCAHCTLMHGLRTADEQLYNAMIVAIMVSFQKGQQQRLICSFEACSACY